MAVDVKDQLVLLVIVFISPTTLIAFMILSQVAATEFRDSLRHVEPCTHVDIEDHIYWSRLVLTSPMVYIFLLIIDGVLIFFDKQMKAAVTGCYWYCKVLAAIVFYVPLVVLSIFLFDAFIEAIVIGSPSSDYSSIVNPTRASTYCCGTKRYLDGLIPNATYYPKDGLSNYPFGSELSPNDPSCVVAKPCCCYDVKRILAYFKLIDFCFYYTTARVLVFIITVIFKLCTAKCDEEDEKLMTQKFTVTEHDSLTIQGYKIETWAGLTLQAMDVESDSPFVTFSFKVKSCTEDTGTNVLRTSTDGTYLIIVKTVVGDTPKYNGIAFISSNATTNNLSDVIIGRSPDNVIVKISILASEINDNTVGNFKRIDGDVNSIEVKSTRLYPRLECSVEEVNPRPMGVSNKTGLVSVNMSIHDYSNEDKVRTFLFTNGGVGLIVVRDGVCRGIVLMIAQSSESRSQRKDVVLTPLKEGEEAFAILNISNENS